LSEDRKPGDIKGLGHVTAEKLLRLAEIYNLAIVVTNRAQANPNAFFGNPNGPAGGHVMEYAYTH
jgi:DNA repair protein RadA